MSLEEDVRNLREVQSAFEDFNDGTITFRAAMDALNRLPGHRELKDTINDFTRRRLTEGMRSMAANILEIQYIQSIPVAEVEPYDSEPDLTEVYEDIDEDELAEMSTDEEDEDDRPPVARRLRF